MSSPVIKQPAAAVSPKKMSGKFSLFSHIKYEHMVAGISGEDTLGMT